MTLLCCRNLAVGHNGTAAARDLDFSVNHGDYLAIVGENGAGKSTLVSTLLGLIPAIAGQIELPEGGLKAGYLPQATPVRRDFPATALEVTLSGCQDTSLTKPFVRRAERERALGALRRTGTEQLARQSFSRLSGGQRQRVLLARALCAARDLLILDEPVSSLDPQATRDMYDLVRSLNREDGMSVITVTHDLPAGIADATHVLHVGATPFYGTAAEYRSFVEALPMVGAWEVNLHELA